MKYAEANHSAIFGTDADGLAEKVAFLSQATTYEEHPTSVDVIETHMSYVFLTDRLVYKLKKPVRFDFLDFSTLEARKANCENELRLNRRLAAAVYLGIVPLTRRDDGQLQLGDGGIVVDWLVKMRRLPAHLMLDAAIRDGRVDKSILHELARVLVTFYRSADRLQTAPSVYRSHFESEVRMNEAHLCHPAYELDHACIERLTQRQLEFINRHGALLEQRARDSRIVEAHGDLRPEHVCLLPAPVVIDSLEFKFEFRVQDPADELSYLALECERLGNRGIGERLLEDYRDLSGDAVDAALIAFYKVFRACLRAKIAVWHIADPALNDPDRWRQRARDYLALAQRHSAAMMA